MLNTCTVKDRTWREFEKRLAALKAGAAGGGPRLVVAGCAPKVDSQGLLEGVSRWGRIRWTAWPRWSPPRWRGAWCIACGRQTRPRPRGAL